MRTVAEIAWVAGLLEGEGSFDYDHRCRIQCTSTDEDVVRRLKRVTGCNLYGPYTWPDRRHYKPIYHVRLYGRYAAQWMITLYPFMGLRRKQKIREALSRWRNIKRGQKSKAA